MKISLSWLKRHLPELGNDVSLISDVLTQGGLEVEGVTEYSPVPGSLSGVVVGEVTSCAPHPGADRLKLTKVNIGNQEQLSVICGAPNVRVGQKVLLATIGSRLTFSSGEQVTIKKSKIRGELSEGMICAEDELGLGSSHDGILILPNDAVPGTTAEKQLNILRDTVFEIGVTPNRSDALSHFGVARDLHACLRSRAIQSTLSNLPVVKNSPEWPRNKEWSIEVKSPQCLRYAGAIIHGVKPAESPSWLKNYLLAIGLRPVNNIVDVTNFILHDCGQPLHAFDLKAIHGKKVVVREADEGEQLVTLDGVQRILNRGNLVICDVSTPMCVAGVFGGANSGVKESTTDLFLESACFSAVSVRKTSKELGLKTDASYRYERGTDPHMVIPALMMAIELIQNICGAESFQLVDDIRSSEFHPAFIKFSITRLNTFIGQEIPETEVRQILSDLGIVLRSENKEEWLLEIPNFKADVNREIDVFEEVLRVYGYNRIEEKPQLSLPVQPQTSVSGLPELLRDFFISAGFYEVMNLSMTSEKNMNPSEEKSAVKLSNPLSSELSFLRQSLLFGLLENALHNRNRQIKNIRLFEIGRLYSAENAERVKESLTLGLLCGGQGVEETWAAKSVEADFFLIKGIFESLEKKLGLRDLRQVSKVTEVGYTAIFESVKEGANDWLWKISDVSAEILKKYGLEGSFVYAQINLPLLISLDCPLKPHFRELPKFPKVRRDLAIIVDKNVEFRQMQELAMKAENKLLSEVNLFDVYEGKNIPAGKKSYAMSFILSSNEATLNEQQIEKSMSRILNVLKENLSAELRS